MSRRETRFLWEHRPHRSTRRKLRADHRFDPFPSAQIAGIREGDSRSWTLHNDWCRATSESVSPLVTISKYYVDKLFIFNRFIHLLKVILYAHFMFCYYLDAFQKLMSMVTAVLNSCSSPRRLRTNQPDSSMPKVARMDPDAAPQQLSHGPFIGFAARESVAPHTSPFNLQSPKRLVPRSWRSSSARFAATRARICF